VSYSKTLRFSEPEPLTQRKSKRKIEGFVCNALLKFAAIAAEEVPLWNFSFQFEILF